MSRLWMHQWNGLWWSQIMASAIHYFSQLSEQMIKNLQHIKKMKKPEWEKKFKTFKAYAKTWSGAKSWSGVMEWCGFWSGFESFPKSFKVRRWPSCDCPVIWGYLMENMQGSYAIKPQTLKGLNRKQHTNGCYFEIQYILEGVVAFFYVGEGGIFVLEL